MIILSYVVMCIIFGTTFLLIKLGLQAGWSPFLFSSLRFIIAGAMVLLLLAVVRQNLVFSIKTHLRLIFLSFLITTVPFAALYWGEQYVSSGEAAILVATSPLFILIINHLKNIEKFNSNTVAGSLISLAGIFITVFTDIDFDLNVESFLAKCLILLAEIAFAFGTIQSKRTLNNIGNPFVFNGFQMLYGGIFLLLLSLPIREDFAFPKDSYGWVILAYFIIVASVLSYGIFYWLIKKTNVFFSSTWTYVSPVVALLLGYFAIDEQIGFLGMLGSGLILTGVILSNIQLLAVKKRVEDI
jgi:drug/metabolite transporter (DMT)-like permease